MFSSAIKRAAIIGSGLAGLSTAYYLSKAGWKVSIIEQKDKEQFVSPAIPTAIFRPFLSFPENKRSRFYFEAYNFFLSFLKQLSACDSDAFFCPCGVLEAPLLARSRKLMEGVRKGGFSEEIVTVLTKKAASELSGIPLEGDCLYYPSAGCVTPGMLYDFYRGNSSFEAEYYGSEVASFYRDGDEWKVIAKDGNELISAPVLIVANAYECASFEKLSFLKTEAVKGQVVLLPPNNISRDLKCALCYSGYLTPAFSGVHVLAASYEHGVLSEDPNPLVKNQLLSKLEKVSGRVADSFRQSSPLAEPVGFRASTFDRFPYIGNLCDNEGSPLPGLYINAGHGSRGIMSTAFGAHIISCMLGNQPPPLEHELLAAIAPKRLLRRQSP